MGDTLKAGVQKRFWYWWRGSVINYPWSRGGGGGGVIYFVRHNGVGVRIQY